MFLPSSAAGQDANLRHRRLIMDLEVVGNTTTSAVRQGPEIAGAVFLKTSGVDNVLANDAAASAAMTVSDGSTIGVLIDGPKCLGGVVKKLYTCDVAELTSVAGTLTTTLLNTTGISALGNVEFTVAGTSLDTETAQTSRFRVTLECQIDESKHE